MSKAADRDALNALRLPAVLRLVAEAAGVEAALKLAQAKGGIRIYVPHKIPQGHWLLPLVGEAGAEALRQRYAGVTIPLPLGLSGALQDARLVARRALDDGASVSQAAQMAGLSERSVYAMLSREGKKSSSPQLSLFDDEPSC